MQRASLSEEEGAALFTASHDAKAERGEPGLARSIGGQTLEGDVHQVAASRGNRGRRVPRRLPQIPANCEAIAGLKGVAGDVGRIA